MDTPQNLVRSIKIENKLIFSVAGDFQLDALNNTKSINKYLPLTYVVRLLKGLWAGNSWGEHWLDLIVILGILVVGAIISTLTFRWE